MCGLGLRALSSLPHRSWEADVLMRSSSLRRLSHGLLTHATRSFSDTAAQHSPVAKKAGLSVAAKIGIAVPTVLIGSWVVSSKDPATRAAIAFQLPVRFARDVFCAGLIAADYKWSLRNLEGEQYELAKRKCHARGADRLQKLCFANRGVYVKLGQHIAQLEHLLPEEYVQTMRRTMLDQCPVSPYSEVSRMITEELGSPPEALFATFEEKPIASASLAQVHRATGHDGKQLAVKVQHAGLKDSCTADILTVECLVRLVDWFFPDFNYTWLVEEIKNTTPKELDFLIETANAERCRKNLQSRRSHVRGQVKIPDIVHHLSTERVITMEFMKGAAVCDRDALQRLGIKPSDVAKLVSETFNEMIFTFGDVHCDPHAANMLVRKKNGKPELVLLDHGLYRQITEEFRLEYAGLWRALVFGDAEGIKQHAAAMNAADSYAFFASMLTMRPWEEITKSSVDHLYLPTSEEGRRQLQQNAAKFAKEITNMLWRVPRPLLLLLKTNDCLRTVDGCLGQSVNTFIITARECTRALNEARLEKHASIGTWLVCAADSFGVELRIAALKFMAWWSSMKATVKPERRPQGQLAPPTALQSVPAA